jgi:hypothetical protein
MVAAVTQCRSRASSARRTRLKRRCRSQRQSRRSRCRGGSAAEHSPAGALVAPARTRSPPKRGSSARRSGGGTAAGVARGVACVLAAVVVLAGRSRANRVARRRGATHAVFGISDCDRRVRSEPRPGPGAGRATWRLSWTESEQNLGHDVPYYLGVIDAGRTIVPSSVAVVFRPRLPLEGSAAQQGQYRRGQYR